MKNHVCNSFYDNDEPALTEVKSVIEPTNVVLNNSTSKKAAEKEPEKVPEKTVEPVKKKSTLWIWAAAYFGAILISPRENINYIDKSNTNLTP